MGNTKTSDDPLFRTLVDQLPDAFQWGKDHPSFSSNILHGSELIYYIFLYSEPHQFYRVHSSIIHYLRWGTSKAGASRPFYVIFCWILGKCHDIQILRNSIHELLSLTTSVARCPCWRCFQCQRTPKVLLSKSLMLLHTKYDISIHILSISPALLVFGYATLILSHI